MLLRYLLPLSTAMSRLRLRDGAPLDGHLQPHNKRSSVDHYTHHLGNLEGYECKDLQQQSISMVENIMQKVMVKHYIIVDDKHLAKTVD
jgi:hypothetical protein